MIYLFGLIDLNIYVQISGICTQTEVTVLIYVCNSFIYNEINVRLYVIALLLLLYSHSLRYLLNVEEA